MLVIPALTSIADTCDVSSEDEQWEYLNCSHFDFPLVTTGHFDFGVVVQPLSCSAIYD
jgi:hypothetical protein